MSLMDSYKGVFVLADIEQPLYMIQTKKGNMFL